MSPFGCYRLGCHQTAAIAAKGDEMRTISLGLFVDEARRLAATHPDVIGYALEVLRKRSDLWDALPADVRAMAVIDG